jgi:CDGSH-type Zn-finger protein
MHAVFDTTRRPWVLPDAGSADSVASTILTCPSGALHYERKDGGADEPTPEHNTIRLVKNGPLYLRGDFTIVNGAGELMVQDTRASLCRCGSSANKPFCDNTHRKIGFEAPATSADPQLVLEALSVGKLNVEATPNGPLYVTGSFIALNGKGAPIYQGTDAAFCRCGGSANKPFCDGTHDEIGFIAE